MVNYSVFMVLLNIADPFFGVFQSYEDFPPAVQFKIDGFNLRDIDLYGTPSFFAIYGSTVPGWCRKCQRSLSGNYFVILPELPPTVHSLRLSVNGDENPFELVRSLEAQPFLKSINLQLTIREASIVSTETLPDEVSLWNYRSFVRKQWL